MSHNRGFSIPPHSGVSLLIFMFLHFQRLYWILPSGYFFPPFLSISKFLNLFNNQLVTSTLCFEHTQITSTFEKSTLSQKWLVQNKLLANQLGVRLPESNWQQRLRERAHLLPAEWRSHIDTDLVPLLFEKSVDTRSPLSFWSESCPSNVWFGRSLRTSRPTCASNLLLSWHFRKPAKPTWLGFSKTPTCVQSTLNVSPSCRRTFSLLAASEVNELKLVE